MGGLSRWVVLLQVAECMNSLYMLISGTSLVVSAFVSPDEFSSSHELKFIVQSSTLKPGYIEFGVVCIHSVIGIQLLLTRRVGYC